MNKIKKILAVCRMTSHCGPVLHTAADQSRLFGAKLYVMHIIHDPFGVEGWNLPLPSLEKDYQNLMNKTRKELDQRVAEIKAQGMEVTELIAEGKPVHEILRTIADEKIDLLVLPAHEESRLEHFLFGGDNEDLIRAMPCSIFLVKREPKPVKEEKKIEYESALAGWKD
jgi:universal stress protein A